MQNRQHPLLMAQKDEEEEPILSEDLKNDNTPDMNVSDSTEDEYRTTPKRWLILFAVSSMVFMHGSILAIWVPVSVPVAQAYNIPANIINLCALQFSILSLPMNVVSSYIYQKFRTDSVLRVATIIALLGVIVRLYGCVNDEFWPILLGTSFIASVYAIHVDSCIMIANKWFPD